MFVTTGHSFRTAYGSVENVIGRLKALECFYAPIADIASTWAFTEWNKEASKNGLKPIFAVQIAVTPNPNAKKPVVYHWTFVAKNNIQSINQLLSLATSQFRYQPLLSYSQALTAEGVFIVTGHKALLDTIPKELVSDNFYIGLSPACSKGFVNRAISEGYKFCATQNNRYVTPDDKVTWEIVCGRGADVQTYPQYILSEKEWFKTVGFDSIDGLREQALLNFTHICENSNATLPQADILRPQVDKTLREMCLDGAKRYGIDLSRPGYMERLDHELEIILDKKFEDYFFVMADIMQFAKANMVVGPGRGSSAGSLVCYCLGITNVDPIEHKLLFFRFIDPNRGGWKPKKGFSKFESME